MLLVTELYNWDYMYMNNWCYNDDIFWKILLKKTNVKFWIKIMFRIYIDICNVYY